MFINLLCVWQTRQNVSSNLLSKASVGHSEAGTDKVLMDHFEKWGINTRDCVTVGKQRWAVRLIEEKVCHLIIKEHYKIQSEDLCRFWQTTFCFFGHIVAFTPTLDFKETHTYTHSYTHTHIYTVHDDLRSYRKKVQVLASLPTSCCCQLCYPPPFLKHATGFVLSLWLTFLWADILIQQK